MDEQATPHTYEQAATALGIQAEAVRARLRRGALRRGPRTNDGRPTVLLSPADIATIRSGVRPIVHPDAGPDPDGRENKALVDLLQTQLERAQAEVVDTRVALAAAQERWEARLDGLAADLAEARQARLVEAEAHARREVELQRMQAEMERLRARPWWRRLFDPG